MQKQQLAFDQGELSQIDQGRGRVGGGNRVRAGESLLYEPVTTLLPIESFPISQFPNGNKNITRRLSANLALPRLCQSARSCISLYLSLSFLSKHNRMLPREEKSRRTGDIVYQSLLCDTLAANRVYIPPDSPASLPKSYLIRFHLLLPQVADAREIDSAAIRSS